MNIAYHDVARLIWESDGGWHYDDSNASTLPEAYATLVHNQKDYTLPTTALRINRVEVIDNAGNYVKMKPLDPAEVTTGLPELLGGSPGMPVYYELKGDSVLLHPAPHSAYATLTNGLYVYMDRTVTEIAVTAASTTPGFAVPFHRILSYACAIDFTQDNQQRQFLAVQKDRLEQGMVRFYSKRAPEMKSTIKPRGRKKWRNYT